MDKIKQIELFIRKLNINQKIKIIDHCKNQYSIRHLSQYLQLNRSNILLLKTNKNLLKRNKSRASHCNHKYQIMQILIEFHSRKIRVWIFTNFSAFKEWLKQKHSLKYRDYQQNKCENYWRSTTSRFKTN